LKLTDGEEEFHAFIHALHDIKKVNVVIVISELGLAANIDLSNRHPGVDVILSSDMDETTRCIGPISPTRKCPQAHPD